MKPPGTFFHHHSPKNDAEGDEIRTDPSRTFLYNWLHPIGSSHNKTATETQVSHIICIDILEESSKHLS